MRGKSPIRGASTRTLPVTLVFSISLETALGMSHRPAPEYWVAATTVHSFISLTQIHSTYIYLSNDFSSSKSSNLGLFSPTVKITYIKCLLVARLMNRTYDEIRWRKFSGLVRREWWNEDGASDGQKKKKNDRRANTKKDQCERVSNDCAPPNWTTP